MEASREFERLNAEYLVTDHFEKFLLSLFRTVANRSGFHEPIKQLFEMARIASENDVPTYKVMDTTLRSFRDAALPDEDDFGSFQRSVSRIAEAALRVMAERAARDNAASGRTSQRISALTAAIEAHQSRWGRSR